MIEGERKNYFFKGYGPQGTRQQELRKEISKELEDNNPSLEHALKNLDFNVLKDILTEICVKAGIDEKAINFLERNEIKSTKEPSFLGNALGNYNPDSNLIAINTSSHERLARGHYETDLLIIKTVIHEMIHAISYNFCEEDIETSSGYHRMANTPQATYRLFDEGVTERITQQVMEEYHRRIGETKKYTEFITHVKKDPEAGGYEEALIFLEAFIGRLAKELLGSDGQNDREKIWKALMEGKIQGRHLGEPQINEEFSQIFSPEFNQQLAKCKTESDLLTLLSLKDERQFFRREKAATFVFCLPKDEDGEDGVE